MSASNDLFTRALQLIPGGVNSPVRAFRSVGGAPFFVKKAQGATLTTADDRELIDFVCTWGPAIHGHNHPKIKAAIATALENGTSFGTPNPYEVEMAELIVKFVPSIQKVRMCNSGTEATMSAIRLARGFTKRDKIIKFAGCYHGHSDSLLIKAGSGALTHGNPDSAGVPASFARETVVLPYNDTAALDAGFAANPGQIACVILEAYCGNVGFIMPDPGYLAHVRAACTKHGALLIFDEVMTGFRIAKGGVQEREKITPDLTCLGKIIGGGLPVGAFGGRAEIMDYLAPLGPVYQAGTLSGNPLAMAAGIAGLKLLEELNPAPRHARPPAPRRRPRRREGQGHSRPGSAMRFDVQHLLHADTRPRPDHRDAGRLEGFQSLLPRLPRRRRLPRPQRLRGRLHQHRPRGCRHRPRLRGVHDRHAVVVGRGRRTPP